MQHSKIKIVYQPLAL